MREHRQLASVVGEEVVRVDDTHVRGLIIAGPGRVRAVAAAGDVVVGAGAAQRIEAHTREAQATAAAAPGDLCAIAVTGRAKYMTKSRHTPDVV